MKAAKHTLDTHRVDDHPISNNDILRLLALVLRCNNFEFNNTPFLQIQGIAIGTRAAPTVANLVMGEFKVDWIYTYDLQPVLYIRYIDDIFLIWTHGLESLNLSHLNSVHTTIKFTASWSDKEIPFLDTLIRLNPDGSLETDLYVKPTDTHMYLHYSSCHPKHKKNSGPYSQLLRVRRICSVQSDFDEHADTILIHYKLRGYPVSVLTEALDKVLLLDRNTLLARWPPRLDDQTDYLFCTITYHPRNPPILDILEKNRHILQSASRMHCQSKSYDWTEQIISLVI